MGAGLHSSSECLCNGAPTSGAAAQMGDWPDGQAVT